MAYIDVAVMGEVWQDAVGTLYTPLWGVWLAFGSSAEFDMRAEGTKFIPLPMSKVFDSEGYFVLGKTRLNYPDA